MTLILDAGALMALERGDRATWLKVRYARMSGTPAITHGGVVAQAWRGGGGRQAQLATALKSVDTLPLDDALGRRAGVLLGQAGTSDAIDAAVAVLSRHGDRIVTSDPDDINHLVATLGLRVDVIPV